MALKPPQPQKIFGGGQLVVILLGIKEGLAFSKNLLRL
jgi:hypothetical protein